MDIIIINNELIVYEDTVYKLTPFNKKGSDERLNYTLLCITCSLWFQCMRINKSRSNKLCDIEPSNKLRHFKKLVKLNLFINIIIKSRL